MGQDAPTSVREVYRDLLDRAPENRMEPRTAPLRRAMAVAPRPTAKSHIRPRQCKESSTNVPCIPSTRATAGDSSRAARLSIFTT